MSEVMAEEVNFLHKVTSWLSDSASWLIPALSFAGFVIMRVVQFFKSQQRIANEVQRQGEELKEIKTELSGKIDKDDFIKEISHLTERTKETQEQVGKIYDHLINRKPSSREGDA